MERSKHYDRNVATLRALHDAGANPNKMHCIEHHLYCHSQASYDLVVSLGRQQGFDVAHGGKHEEEEGLWSLDLILNCLPNMDEIERQSLKVEEIAERAQADYDGWGTEVEE